MFRRKPITIAPAEKLTLDGLNSDQRTELSAWFSSPAARLYLRLLATEQDNLIVESRNLLVAGKDTEARVMAAKSVQCGAFAAHMQAVLHLQEQKGVDNL